MKINSIRFLEISIDYDNNFIDIVQVWICLVGSLIAMVIAFACLSGLYRKYVHSSSPEDLKKTNVADSSSSSSVGLLNYRSLSNYTLYMVTILTNHGIKVAFDYNFN